jgi:circadian clock protein KaiB
MRELVMSARGATQRSRGEGRGDERAPRYEMRLFVAGSEPNSVMARTSLERICSDHLEGRCTIEIVDVLKDFRPALAENILVTPALVVRRGQARTVIFGNLTNIDRVLDALEIGSEPA